jgi:hypothetical protein
MATKKKVTKLKDIIEVATAPCINEVEPDTRHWRRQEAVELAVKLFSDTPFADILRVKDTNGNAVIADVPFYEITENIYQYLTTGTFPSYEAFKLKAK